MGRPPLRIDIAPKDQKELAKLLSGGVQQVRVVLRALALLQSAKGASAPQISQVVPLTSQAIRTIARRYEQGGLESALFETQRPGATAVLDDAQKQRIIAMVCSNPPESRARWTVRLVAQEAVKRRLVPRVGRETVRILLLDHDLKPWREKMWCVADLTEEYISKTEDVLETYEKPYDPAEPVVCLDEKPVTLHADVHPLRQPSRGGKRDGITSTRGAARPMFSAPWNRRPAATSPGSATSDHLRQRAAIHRQGLQGVHSHLRHHARPDLAVYPQSNGKIERWHKSLKEECIRPRTPLSLDDARRLVSGYVDHYNNIRLNSATAYITPKDMLAGRQQEIHAERDRKLEAAALRWVGRFPSTWLWTNLLPVCS